MHSSFRILRVVIFFHLLTNNSGELKAWEIDTPIILTHNLEYGKPTQEPMTQEEAIQSDSPTNAVATPRNEEIGISTNILQNEENISGSSQNKEAAQQIEHYRFLNKETIAEPVKYTDFYQNYVPGAPK